MNPDIVVARTEMLIRRPIAEVFEAFVNPEITTHFWFTKSSGSLAAGQQITWTWEMYDVSAQVNVRELEANRRILIEFPTTVEWLFTPHGSDATLVTITNSGFPGNIDSVVAQALDSTGAFSWVLAGAKAWLEHHIELNLIADRYPGGLDTH